MKHLPPFNMALEPTTFGVGSALLQGLPLFGKYFRVIL